MDREPTPSPGPSRDAVRAPRAVPIDLVLVRGVHVVPRHPHLLALLGEDVVATVPDTPSVRRLLDDLAHGLPGEVPDGSARRALARLVGSGLTESRSAVAARSHARAAVRVLVDAHDACTTTALELLMASRVPVTTRSESATHALVVADGEVARHRVERWMRTGIPHLIVVHRGPVVVVGPYVQPGRSSCLHCLDAHLHDRRPAHADLVAQLVSTGPLTPVVDPALQTAATAWAVRDLVTAVEGGTPSTWSATVTLTAGRDDAMATRRREWPRHPGCGCAWAALQHPVPTG